MLETRDFAQALADTEQPGAAFDALCRLAQETVGAKLFTVMTFESETGMARRSYSNMPEDYPVSGTKPANETDWSRQVLRDRQTFVANDLEGIRAVFYDHELIDALGCQSVMNLPIVVADRVIGTINCLHEAGHYTDERVAAAEALRLPGAACLLLARALDDDTPQTGGQK